MTTKTKITLGGAALLLAACSDTGTGGGAYDPASGKPDYYGIMDRMVVVADYYSQAIQQSATDQGVTGTAEDPILADEDTMAMFTGDFEMAINQQPALYNAPMGVELQGDGSFLGYEDADGDGEQGMGEDDLWTLEIDEANDRLVLTTEGEQRYGFSGIGTGLIAGAILGNMMGRQRAAGVNPGRFSSANVSNRSASAVRSARSSARTGGARVGK